MNDSGKACGATFKEGSAVLTGKEYFAGYSYTCSYSVPRYENVNEYALIVTFDGMNAQIVQVMARLYEEGIAPPTIVIGISGGTYLKTQSEGYDLGLRQLSYDVFDRGFADLIVEEIIPEMTSRFGLKISDNPDWHMAAGGSSGGICAWSCAWFRNDYFRRVYMSSPTFSAMTKGYEAPVLMRLCETKTLRGFMDWSENEPNDYFGSSYLAGLVAKSALEYAGYDFEYRYNEGEGHCSRFRYEVGLTEVMRSMWRDHTAPVKAKRNSSYIGKLTPHTSEWERAEAMPDCLRAYSAGGVFTSEGGSIFCTPDNGARREVASGFADISALAVSADMWRLYIAERDGSIVYSMAITETGDLKDKMQLGSLYTDTFIKKRGVSATCVDSEDRIYLVTDMGIQVLKGYGIVCAIIDSPFDKRAEGIAFGGEGMRYLYVKCDGKVYRRLWNVAGRPDEKTVTKPASRDYYY